MAERAEVLLQTLLSRLRPWFRYVLRSTHGTDVDVSPGKLPGEFNIKVSGVDKEFQPWSCVIAFTREMCFGTTYQLSPAAWQVVKRPCDHAREIVQTILTQRGYL